MVTEMKKIKLTEGKYGIQYTLVDNNLFKELSKYRWFYSHGYACMCIPGLKGKRIYMHRFILKVDGNIDHINKNKLDNRKKNLREANKRINSINRGLQSNNTSGYKGISWNKGLGKWEAYIWNNRVKITLGYYKSINIAIMHRKKAERSYHEL